ncbi:MAG: hypothetical protein ACR652_18240 [Methylocystis sp.]|uniref:hypothetical protein n=1 Tax=Methylocystis sp. TaxID=1911079 RepID=UPI003DA5C8FA
MSATDLKPAEDRPDTSVRALVASFARVQPLEWMFIGFGWLTLAYMTFIVVEQLRPEIYSQTGQPYKRWPFDILPVFAGVCAVVFGWRALRLSANLADVIDKLDTDAGLVEQSDVTIAAFKDLLKKDIGKREIWAAAAVATMLMAGYASMFVAGNLSFDDGPVGAGFAILLGSVMLVSGACFGYLLGRLWGSGRLPAMMKQHGIVFSGLTSIKAQQAMEALEDVYVYAELATMVVCHWFALWWILFSLGIDPLEYEQWTYMFLACWASGFAFFLVGARAPAIALSQNRDATGASVEEQNELRRKMLKEAQEDLARLTALPTPQTAEWLERRDLEVYIAQLEAVRVGKPSLDKKFLDFLIIENLVLFLVPLAYRLIMHIPFPKMF